MQDLEIFIEIPMGGSVKYEFDEKEGMIKVDRIMFTAFVYPFNYGYIKNTLSTDGDPVDVVLLASHSILPGAVISGHAIGVLEMEDEEGIDNKTICVPLEKIDPNFGRYKTIKDLPDITKMEIKHFFDHYKELEEGKWVKTGKYQTDKEAYKSISRARERFQNKS